MINVDSSLQMYTMIVSWKYYGAIWDLLVGTGIVFIPVAMAIVSQLLEARANGSMLGNSSDRLLSGVEVKIVSIFIIMLFMAMPSTPLQLNSDSITLASNPDKLTNRVNATETSSCGATGSSFDDIESSDGDAICGTNSPIPLWWYGVLRVSHAITQAVVSEMTADTNEGFRALVQFTRSGKILNPQLKMLVNRFETECYGKALAAYSNATKNYQAGGGIDGPDGGFFGDDVSWQGSEFLVENYYPILESDDPVEGIDFDEDLNKQVDTEIAIPAAGKVQCSQFWELVSERVLAEATSEEAGDNRATRTQRFRSFLGSDDINELIIRNYIVNSNPQGSHTTESINKQANRGNGLLQNGADRVAELYSGREFAHMAFTATFLTDALVKSLPIIQAYILMFIVFMLPFGFVISGFSWSFVVQASVLVFFVTFWSALWGFAAWIDDSMAKALWPGNGDGLISGVQSFLGIGTEMSLQQATAKFIHSAVTAMTYLGAPTFTAWVLSAAGAQAAYFAGGSISGVSGPVGSAVGASAASRRVSSTADRVTRALKKNR